MFYKKLTGFFFIFTMLFMVVGCQMAPELTPMQKRQITTKTFDGSYDNVYSATMTVLQDNQYVIKQSNKDSGFISAEKEIDTSYTGMMFLGMPVSRSSDDHRSVSSNLDQLSATVSKLNNKTVEVRLLIQQKAVNQMGGVNRSQQSYAAEVYHKLFNDIRTEILRREAMGRG